VYFEYSEMNKAASPQPLHKNIVYFELIQSGKKKHNGFVTPMCVSAISGKFRTGIQFFLFYRNEVSYKTKKYL